jgi:hypothetical protein
MGPFGHPFEEILQRIRQVRDVAALTHQRAVSGSVRIRMARWRRLFRACLACGQRGDEGGSGQAGSTRTQWSEAAGLE